MQAAGGLGEQDRLVRQAQIGAERMLGAVRIVVALILLVALTGAAADIPPEGRLMLQRQIATAYGTIGAYAVVGAAALLLARLGRLTRPATFVFATFDVLFLAANLELNFHNTGLSANWITSLPAVWLVPLVLAFAALRLDLGIAAWTTTLLGAALAVVTLRAGWDVDALPAPIATLAPFHSLPPMGVRGVMVGLAGLVIILAVRRAGQLLARAVETERRRLNLTRYLPPQIAARLEAGDVERLRQGSRQVVAVLFVDVRGFSARARTMEPEALRSFLTELRTRLTRAAHARGGVIDKFIGDGALIVFGVAEPAADDARRAIGCAFDMLGEVAAWNAGLSGQEWHEPVEIGIGGHWGEAFVGVLGDLNRLEHTVIGDVVNIAERLQETTRTVGRALVVSADLLAAAGPDLAAPSDWLELSPRPLRGRGGTIRAFAAGPRFA